MLLGFVMGRDVIGICHKGDEFWHVPSVSFALFLCMLIHLLFLCMLIPLLWWI